MPCWDTSTAYLPTHDTQGLAELKISVDVCKGVMPGPGWKHLRGRSRNRWTHQLEEVLVLPASQLWNIAADRGDS